MAKRFLLQLTIFNMFILISWAFSRNCHSEDYVLCFKVFRLDALALSVIATATWLGGRLGVGHSRYCIKTTKPIRKLFGPSGRPII